MKAKLFILVCLLVVRQTVSAQFIMPTTGTQTATTCGGMFYDSGGTVGNYSNNENGELVFCPAVPGQYVTLVFSSIMLSDVGDMLRLYSGTGPGGPVLGSITGPLNTTSFCGVVVSQDTLGGCLTAQFISNSSGVSAGWSVMLSCNPTPSIAPAGINCTNPIVIPSIPFSDSAQCTQCMLNDFQNQTGICNASYAGEDRVYSYTTTGPQCDSITMSNTSGNPALAIYLGCPGAGGVCLTPTPLVGNNSMQFNFPATGTYYIIVDEPSGYACYDLSITPCATGIDETSLNSRGNISISQNILTEQITFRWKNNKPSTIMINDCLGRLMYSATTGESFAEFSTGSWAERIYFVRVIDGENVYAGTFVVAR